MPDPVDTFATVWFFALFFGAPLLGWFFAFADYRAYVRSLRRAMIVVRRYTFETPLWALRDRPQCLVDLGLAPGCTHDEIMAAYRRKVMKAHPDRGGDRRQFELLQTRLHEALELAASTA